MGWMRLLGVVIGLELRQRVRSVAWYVLLGVVGLVVGGIALLLFLALEGWQQEVGAIIFSTVIFLALLVVTLVTPALSGNAINGDRESGTLAATQLTQVTAAQLVLGKVLASWVASLGFVAVCVPILLIAAFAGGLRLEAVLVSIPVLVIEVGVISAIGVGVSGLIRKPIMSTVVSYLVIAFLSVGSLVGFGVGTVVFQSTDMVSHPEYVDSTDDDGNWTTTCIMGEPIETTRPRPDRIWWMLAASPYVVLADAVPFETGAYDEPVDLFSAISWLVRSAQLPPEDPSCDWSSDAEGSIEERTIPSWYIGLAQHLLLAAGAVVWAILATRAPARALAPGSRIA